MTPLPRALQRRAAPLIKNFQVPIPGRNHLHNPQVAITGRIVYSRPAVNVFHSRVAPRVEKEHDRVFPVAESRVPPASCEVEAARRCEPGERGFPSLSRRLGSAPDFKRKLDGFDAGVCARVVQS